MEMDLPLRISPKAGSARDLMAGACTPEILSLEDDPNDRVLMAHAFRGAGLRLRCFRRSSALLDHLKKLLPESAQAPDLLLLDIYLPGENGLTLLNWIRTQPKFIALPIIVVTGSLAPSDREKALEFGANAVFEKGLSFAPLVELVTTLLRPRAVTKPRKTRKSYRPSPPRLVEEATLNAGQLKFSL